MLDDVAEFLGKVLEDVLEKRTINVRCLTLASVAFSLNNNETDSIFSSRFWNSFFNLKPGEYIYIGNNSSSMYPGVGLTKAEFLDLLKLDLPGAGIYRFMQSGPIDSVACLSLEIEKIRTSDFSTRPELLCPVNDTGEEEQLESFASLVKQKVGEGIVSDLILEGFIRKDFDLYISKYPNDAKPNVVNFIYHCYQRGVQNLDYVLDNDDCCAILNIIPAIYLGQSCCFNPVSYTHLRAHET